MERLDSFMARANAAYYATHDPFKDFTTSPEISQVFGEILGLWAVVTWDLLGRPDPVLLVEAGPGRGTLMTDALRAVAQVAPAFRAAISLHLIESSPRLRAIQAEQLPDATWHSELATVPLGPFLLLANEFLDALPIRQFVQRDGRWLERFVDNGHFQEVAGTPPMAINAGKGLQEINEPALSMVRQLGERLTHHVGAALFLDYGPEHSAAGESLQALRDGRPADPLEEPGSADLTAHVDFAALAEAARQAGAKPYGPVPQGIFLARLGLFQRTGRLARTQSPERAAALLNAAQRLAEPDRMGRLFKVLAVCHPGCQTPPGFESP